MERRDNSRAGRAVDGVLLFDKPAGATSNAVLQRIKRLFRARKAGHTGTLDPMATGLLPICFGESSKFSGALLDADKAYRARLRLGVRTDSGDRDGAVLQTRPVAVSADALESVLARFRGTIEQTPPMYSALKRDGKPLYEYARAGVVLERGARTVTIHALTLTEFAPPFVELELTCSKGTYVRVLAEDIGEALGCGAHLSELRRLRVGPFDVADAVDWATLESMADEDRQRLLRGVDCLVAAYPVVRLDRPEEALVKQGRALPRPATVSGPVRLYGADGAFLGLGEQAPEGTLRPTRLLRTGDAPAVDRKS